MNRAPERREGVHDLEPTPARRARSQLLEEHAFNMMVAVDDLDAHGRIDSYDETDRLVCVHHGVGDEFADDQPGIGGDTGVIVFVEKRRRVPPGDRRTGQRARQVQLEAQHGGGFLDRGCTNGHGGGDVH